MVTAGASIRDTEKLNGVDRMVKRFNEDWRQGRGDLDHAWAEAGPEKSISLLAAMVKADLNARFDRGERPEAAEYLDRFPELRAESERVLSLVYEEYCLREERNERPDTEEFCARYAPWKDSLESQLRYHRVLSMVVGPTTQVAWYPANGDRFGPFLIREELGRGGAARVYLARDESLGGREVALKISQDRGSEPAILGRLEHAHIVPVLSVVNREQDGLKLRGLCMPFRPGLPLDAVISRVNPASQPKRATAFHEVLRAAAPDTGILPGGAGWNTFPVRGSYVDGVAWIVAVLAEALACAHSKPIFHRDVKPANVLLTYSGGPQLLDFNLSHDPHSAAEAEAALQGGTLPYMAPEQLEAFLDPARWDDVAGPADLYSLGLMLRELLTGLAPEAPDPKLPLPRAIRALLDRRVDFRPDLHRHNARIPHALAAIAERCLAYSPADRYQNASDLADDLRRYLARRPLKYARNPSRTERLGNWVRRQRVYLAAALFVAVVATGVSVGPHIGRPIPVVDRPEFARMVAKFDEKNDKGALASLKTLEPDAYQSAVAGLYAAMIHARAGELGPAAAALARAWTSPDAASALALWGKKHPPFTAQAEQLARSLISRSQEVIGPLWNADHDPVVRTFRLVLALDPNRFGSGQGLALVEEYHEDWADAHALLTRLSGTLGPDNGKDRARFQRMDTLNVRARVSTKWGRSLLDAHKVKEAVGHLKEAISDLDRSDPLIEPGDQKSRFNNNYVRCEATLALADAASLDDDHVAAVDLYQRSKLLLDRLRDYPKEQVLVFEKIKQKVTQRVESELPKQEAYGGRHSTHGG